MSLPAVVLTPRLRLPLWTADEARDVLAGRGRPHWHPDYPRPADRDAAALRREGDPWGPRHIVRAGDGLVVGSIGFFGPPAPSGPPDAPTEPEVEVGFGLVPEAHGHGAATEALRGLLRETDRAGVRVRGAVRPDHTPSLRVLATCRFTDVLGADEDGRLVLVRPLPGAGNA
ncbi:GNAT family N-acetyltransferase [Nocardioides donggukensis]|uniref:GNAT family N-acetyltransferase n=1 Tax=Nocardioides donggukensis TaxID=2774019 RepID=A0A927K127_9ACTN|nr:GNAT family N-acetyltransferase [Nocardioides donggukensis]MBD8868107.1 GNAT family N-acetyltransferase [Nocardioides donggukensis]